MGNRLVPEISPANLRSVSDPIELAPTSISASVVSNPVVSLLMAVFPSSSTRSSRRRVAISAGFIAWILGWARG